MLTTSAPAIRALIVLALLLAQGGCGSQARFESYMARGQSYFAAGNLDKASVEFRNALQIEPKNGDAFYFNGRVAERRGNLREASDFYQAALDARPGDDRARGSLAKVFVLGGATQRALEVIAPGLLEHPDNPDLLAARAAARHQLKDDGEALEDAERAVRAAPANENAISVLAALALRGGDGARAVSLVSDAVTKAPASVDLRRILASVYLSTDQPQKAAEQMRRIIALEPSEMTPRLQLATHFAQTHELDAAQQVLEEAVRDLPHRDGAKLALVDFITTQRSREQGEKVLRAFIARDPDNEDLRLGLGMLLKRSGATQDALATYREVVRRDGMRPKGLAARDRIAAIDIEAGQEVEAKQLIAEVLRDSPRDDDALIMRANIELSHNDPTNAIVDLRAVLGDQPKSVVLQRSLARAYLAKNEPGMAEDALRSAMEAAPGDASIKVELGQFLVQTDRASQAARLLVETAHDTPGDPQVQEALVRAYIADRDLPAARAAAENLKTLHPDAAEGYYLAGLIAHDEGRPEDAGKNLERALEILTRAVAVDPRSWVAYRELAEIYEGQGRIDEAMASYEVLLKGDSDSQQLAANNLAMLLVTYKSDQASLDRARSLTARFDLSDNASFLDTTGWVHFKRREFQDAVAVLGRAADRSPDSKVIRNHLDLARSALATAAARKAPQSG